MDLSKDMATVILRAGTESKSKGGDDGQKKTNRDNKPCR